MSTVQPPSQPAPASQQALTPQQDHHLKNQLLLLALQREFDQLWFDHTAFLSNLQYPFSNTQNLHSVADLLDTHENRYPFLKFIFINFVKTFPYFKNVDLKYRFTKNNYKDDMIAAAAALEADQSQEQQAANGYPLMGNRRHRKSSSVQLDMVQFDHTNNNSFWRYKVMPFFNYILSKNLSNSVDRLELTKRKKANLKIFRLFVLFFSSSIATTKEEQYYSNLNGGSGDLAGQGVNAMTGEQLNQQVTQNLEKLVSDLDNESGDSLDRAATEALANDNDIIKITKRDLLSQLESPPFLNGYTLNIVGVRKQTSNEGVGGNGAEISGGGSSFFLSMNIFKREPAKQYEFILSVKYKISLKAVKKSAGSADDKKGLPGDIAAEETEEEESDSIVQEFIIFRTYTDFKKLNATLKKNFPEVTLPKLPQKYKHSTLVKNIFNENEVGANANSNSNNSYQDDEDDAVFSDDEDSGGGQTGGYSGAQGINNLDEIFFGTDEFNKDSERILNYILTKHSKSASSGSSAPASPITTGNGASSSLRLGLKKLSVRSPKSPTVGEENHSHHDDDSSSNNSFYSTNSKTEQGDSAGYADLAKLALPREKLRLLLNNYLKALIKNPQIANSIYIKEFFFRGSTSYNTLTAPELQDIKYRKHLDYLTLKNQYIFQKKIYLINMKLKNELTAFKNIVLNSNNEPYLRANYTPEKIEQYAMYVNLGPNENVLSKLLEEFKYNTKIEQFSPITKTLIKWIKLQFASFVYDLFFTNNSFNNNNNDTNNEENFNDAVSFELFNQIKKLHSFFPYTILQSILRLTNPLLMIKRLLEFFLYQPPNLIPGFLNFSKSSDDGTSSGHRSLIQVLFHNVISSDLSEINSKVNGLTKKLLAEDPNYGKLISTFKRFLQMNETKDPIKLKIIDDFKANKGSDLILLVLFNKGLSAIINANAAGGNGGDDAYQLQYLRAKVVASYEADQKLAAKGESSTEGDAFQVLTKEAETYRNLKKLFQLLIRQNDKKIMNELWSESYLNNFIKDFIIIFFEPLIKIFTKNDSFRKVIKVFQNFMDDMISLIEYLFDYVYLLNANEVILSIYLVISKYQDFVLEFIHETYMNDTEGFFENIVGWVSGIVRVMRFFKEGGPSPEEEGALSIIRGKKIDLETLVASSRSGVNFSKLTSEVDTIINNKKQAVISRLMRAEVNRKAFQQSKAAKARSADLIRQNWEKVNGISFLDTKDLGFNEADISDFNADLEDLEKVDSNDSQAVNDFLDEKKNYYDGNAGMKAQGQEAAKHEEIGKLEGEFKACVVELLKQFQAENPI